MLQSGTYNDEYSQLQIKLQQQIAHSYSPVYNSFILQVSNPQPLTTSSFYTTLSLVFLQLQNVAPG